MWSRSCCSVGGSSCVTVRHMAPSEQKQYIVLETSSPLFASCDQQDSATIEKLFKLSNIWQLSKLSCQYQHSLLILQHCRFTSLQPAALQLVCAAQAPYPLPPKVPSGTELLPAGPLRAGWTEPQLSPALAPRSSLILFQKRAKPANCL
jgi:hypothetical protein